MAPESPGMIGGRFLVSLSFFFLDGGLIPAGHAEKK